MSTSICWMAAVYESISLVIVFLDLKKLLSVVLPRVIFSSSVFFSRYLASVLVMSTSWLVRPCMAFIMALMLSSSFLSIMYASLKGLRHFSMLSVIYTGSSVAIGCDKTRFVLSPSL